MKITESSEAFTYHVLSKIDPEIMDSFTQRQLDAIYQGLTDCPEVIMSL